MNDITDFNDLKHRVQSACASWQKGVYHLFMLKNRSTTEAFARTLRLYQCIFQLSLTQLLLDTNFSIRADDIQSRLKRRCKDPQHPTRKELDPASIVTHTTLERRWVGFNSGHPLHEVSKHTLVLYHKIVEARHNILYRPFMLAPNFWEDCTLIDLLDKTPSVDEVEEVYQSFIKAIFDWYIIELEAVKQSGSGKRIAGYFLDELFIVYRDRRDNRPTETLLLSYARLLNSNDQNLLEELREYRNQLVDLKNLLKLPLRFFSPEWRVGEL